ncbi:hypothetical protein [Alcaligenes faecalis]|uniref:Uncharacterized protein n=1 Tax=Alcaligenes faecalis TaxID=511 RepID=A0AAE9KM79_ALCFA|nr:hypothetical protein [Alcaligenes faecalis]UPL19893.1 hypothetical protein MXF72_10665 [Alcaligenes faecalis]
MNDIATVRRPPYGAQSHGFIKDGARITAQMSEQGWLQSINSEGSMTTVVEGLYGALFYTSNHNCNLTNSNICDCVSRAPDMCKSLMLGAVYRTYSDSLSVCIDPAVVGIAYVTW